MLSCKEVTKMASDYRDKNLPWYRLLSIRFHLLMCDHCKRFMRHFKLTIEVAASIGRKSATDPEVDQIIALTDGAEKSS